jgi:hypothetical protein
LLVHLLFSISAKKFVSLRRYTEWRKMSSPAVNATADVTPKYDQRVRFFRNSLYFVEGVSPFGFWNSLSFAVTNEGRDRTVLIYRASRRQQGSQAIG